MRVFDPYGIYHLTAHGIDDMSIFPDDLNCQDFVLRLGRVIRAERLIVYAACLLETHHHLLVSPNGANLSDAMQGLHGGYARAFNARRGRRGAVFEARFRDRQIADDVHLCEAIRYIALNPTRAGKGPPETWPWSTYAQLLGARPLWPGFDPSHALGLFASVEQLRDYVSTPRPAELFDTFKRCAVQRG